MTMHGDAVTTEGEGPSQPVVYLYGKEPFLLDAAVLKQIASLTRENGEEVEVLRLDADELTPFALGEALQFSALFVTRRVVLIQRPRWLTGDKKQAKTAEDFSGVLASYLEHPEPGQTLLLTSLEKPAANKVVKQLEKSAAALLVPVTDWTVNQIKDWIRESLQAAGKKLDEASVHHMATGGQDLYYLKNLLDKIILLDETEIPASVLEQELDLKSDIKIFKMLDAVFARNPQAALQAMQQLLQQGEAAPYILFMLFRQCNLLAWVKALQEEGHSPQSIETQTGQKSFTVKNLLKYSRNFTWEEIEARLADILLIDTSMKSTTKDTRMQLECLLPKFARS